MPRRIHPDCGVDPRCLVRRCTTAATGLRAALHVGPTLPRRDGHLTRLAWRMLWTSVREGTTLMLDLWILALTLGLFGVAAGFVRVLERL